MTLSALTLALTLLQAAPPPGELGWHARISHPNPRALADRLEAEGFDVIGASVGTGVVDLAVSVEDLRALREYGLVPTLVAPGAPLPVALGGGAPDAPPTGYHDLASIVSILQTTVATYPNITKLVDVAATYGPGATWQGRPIWVLKISDNANLDEDEPNVFFVSNHHAREIITPEIALDIISRLTQGYGVDPQITNWVDSNEIWVAPTWNPDGLNHVWTVYNLWRKNRHPYGASFGVDQNRNYPLGWSSICAGSTSPSSDTYKGPSSASEEETQSMRAFGRDRYFAKGIDYHSSGREVLYGYRCSPFPASLTPWYVAQATALTQACGYADIRVPSAEGEHYQWQIAELGTFAFLIETGTSFQPTYATALAEAAMVWGGSVWMLNSPIPLQGHVRDACTGKGVVADIAVAGINWQMGEIRRSEARYGRYHYFLPPGNYSVTFSKAGYAPSTQNVAIVANASTALEVSLQPLTTVATTGSGQIGTTLGLQFSSPADAGLLYFAAATASGTSPGIPINACTLPLNPDPISFLSLVSAPPFSGFFGTLDGAGQAAGSVAIPLDGNLVGLGLDFAFVTFDLAAGALVHPSNAAHATILP